MRTLNLGILRATLEKFDREGMKNFSPAEGDVLVDAARDLRDAHPSAPDFGAMDGAAAMDPELANLTERRGTPPGSAIVYESLAQSTKVFLRYLTRAQLLEDDRGAAVAQQLIDGCTAVFNFIEGEYALRAASTVGK